MPRPKTELTKSGKAIGVRVTQSEYLVWQHLGGSKWLRKHLQDEREKLGDKWVEDFFKFLLDPKQDQPIQAPRS